jgi:hypothetical protein
MPGGEGVVNSPTSPVTCATTSSKGATSKYRSLQAGACHADLALRALHVGARGIAGSCLRTGLGLGVVHALRTDEALGGQRLHALRFRARIVGEDAGLPLLRSDHLTPRQLGRRRGRGSTVPAASARASRGRLPSPTSG